MLFNNLYPVGAQEAFYEIHRRHQDSLGLLEPGLLHPQEGNLRGEGEEAVI